MTNKERQTANRYIIKAPQKHNKSYGELLDTVKAIKNTVTLIAHKDGDSGGKNNKT